MSKPIRCHHCGDGRLIGETSQTLAFVGMFKYIRDCGMVDGQRDTYRCRSCGWCNVFQPAAQDYRDIELKRAS